MQKIIEVRRDGEKTPYHFLDNGEIKVGSKVVVNFEDFVTVCEVTKAGIEVSDDKAKELGKITRIATESDLSKFNELKAKAKSQVNQIKKKSLELGLMMKFVSAEYSLDDSKILIVFSSEDRVDFRQLLKELAGMLKTRIELKQIGQRDEVKVCGGVGPCGQPCCCARFLNNFDHVTVKMAKTQGLSLSPTKINGICGRLMCCLAYESETYEKILEKMPKINSEVNTPNGKGTVVYNDILRERVSVRRQSDGDTFVVEDFALEEIGMNGKPAKPRVKEEPKEEPKTEEKHEIKKEEIKAKSESQENLKENQKPKHFEHKHDKSNNFKPKKENKSFGMEIVDSDSNIVAENGAAEAKNQNYSKKPHGHGKWKHFGKSFNGKKS